MREVAFGQYYPADSFAHKLDPRTKILFLICYIIGVFITKNFYSLAVCALLFALAVALSKVPLRTLVKSVKAVLLKTFT